MSSRQVTMIRSCASACLIGFVAVLAGCDDGSGDVKAPEEVKQIQQNEMEARQKAFGKAGVPGLDKKSKGTNAAAGKAGAEAPK